MILDNGMTLAKDQAVTAAAATTNVLDQKKAGSAVDGLYLIVHCSASATSSGAATVNLKLQTSSKEDFSSDSVDLLQSGAIAKTSLTKDTIVYKARVPFGTKQYIRGYHDVATADLTAGKFSWYFTAGADLS